MATRFPIEVAKSAEGDLLDILAWYSAQQVPEVGRRLVRAVFQRIEQLGLFPDSGKAVPEFDTPWLRELQSPPFRIVYRRDETLVTIVRVWRAERLLDPDLGGNARREFE